MYTPRSLADATAMRVFPINETVKLTGCLLIICLVPINMNFVFSRFTNKSFVQHQVATLRKFRKGAVKESLPGGLRVHHRTDDRDRVMVMLVRVVMLVTVMLVTVAMLVTVIMLQFII